MVVGNGDFGVGVNCFVVLYCYWFVVGDMVGEKFVSGENYLFIVWCYVDYVSVCLFGVNCYVIWYW